MNRSQIAVAAESAQQTAALVQALAAPLLALPQFTSTAAALRLAVGLLGPAAVALREGADPPLSTWAQIDADEVSILIEDAKVQTAAEREAAARGEG